MRKKALLSGITIFLLVLQGVLFCPLQAQSRKLSSDNKKAIEAFDKGLKALSTRQLKQAVGFFEQAIKKDDKFAEAYLKLGNAYKQIGERAKATEALAKGFSMGDVGDQFSYEHFFYAEFLLANADYVGAEKHLALFSQSRNPNKALVKQAEKLTGNLTFANEALKNPVNFKPQRLPDHLNQFHHHYFPAITADEQTFIFTARIGQDPGQDEDIYVSKKGAVGWSAPKPISENVLSPGNEGAASISGDGKTLVFTACERPDSFGGCDLFISTREGDNWSKPRNLGKQVNSSAWDSQPSLSADGRTIYFASERPGGLGKADIWMTQTDQNGEWQKPVNLGNKVNTPERESSPSLHASSSTLYFASEGHPGMGGVDLYRTDFEEGAWSAPVNLGYPLNTAANESTIFIDAANKKGYFSKDSGGGRVYRIDLYEFDVPNQWKSKVRTVYNKGRVLDAVTKKPVAASVDVFNLSTDALESKVRSDRENGEYIVVLKENQQYGIYATSPGYLPRSLSFDFSNTKNFNASVLDIYLQPVAKGASMVLQNLFFGTNKFSLEDKSKTELNQVIAFLTAYPQVRILISGFTDDVGSESANQKLSENRAKSVQQYLTKHGIDAGRIEAKGFGEQNPAVPNTSEENRAQNRRIELQVL